ncbi:MAG TPA: T9SS type A sorting domain-containing protein, partial [Rhodothermales bacterium]|nr:T9SS type A sorting domain-containing protein [Rhodothermales bacterium]
LALGAALLAPAAGAQTAQTLPFTQNWTSTGLITADDTWTGVPGIIGYRGDALATIIPTDAATILADGAATPIDVTANQTTPSTFITGGVAEFEITDPVVALQGSGTADAPHIVIRVITTGLSSIRFRCNLRDIDDAADDAAQQVAIQYRVGTTGDYVNVPGGYFADVTTAVTATQVTPVDLTLPANANNVADLFIRVLTTNAIGSDEWVGVDDIQVTSGTTAGEAGANASALRLDAPNPVRGSATLAYALPASGAARLTVYDVLGRTVAVLLDGTQAAGTGVATFNASTLAPGAYVLRLEAAGSAVTRTVSVVR